MSFIRKHIESRIWMQYELNRHISCGGFLYLDSPVELSSGKKINRIKDRDAYLSEEIVPIDWKSVPGPYMARVSEQLSAGSFYGYKKIDGKSYKIRKKK